MKTKEWQQFKTRKIEELKKDLMVYKNRLNKLREDLARGKVKNIYEVHSTKKTIARIHTLLSEQ